MKKKSQLGLVIEGNSTASTVLKLPNLAEDLGPIKAASLRVARRLPNILKAGYAVADYEDLQAANLILLRIPDAAVPKVVEDLCASELVLKDVSFVLCESWLPLNVLQLLADRGASIATLNHLPTSERNWYAVEGLSKAVRQTRRFLKRNSARSDELKPGSKPYLFASQLMAASLPTPILVSAQQALRATGFSGNILSALIEQMALKMLKDFLRGARPSWGGPLTECAPEISGDHLKLLQETSPDLAYFLNEHIRLAKKVMAAASSESRTRLGQ